MRALVDVMKLSQQAQRIQELEAENEALLKYASELVDKCVALKASETAWRIRAAELAVEVRQFEKASRCV